MKKTIIILSVLLIAGCRCRKDSERDVHEFIFTDVQKCSEASDAYKHIAVGSPLADVSVLSDTSLPNGLHWPEYPQKDGSVVQGIVVLPPKEWGTNYVGRTDGQSGKTFYFFHDGRVVTKIVWSGLQLTTTRPKGPRPKETLEKKHQKPIGPLIMIEKEE